MSNNQIIASLKARLESELDSIVKQWAENTLRPGLGQTSYQEHKESFLEGYEAATERLMAIVEKAVEGLEYFSKLESSSNVSYDVIIGKKAGEFLNMIKDEVRVK